jgi:AraC-like DNA-binding protein
MIAHRRLLEMGHLKKHRNSGIEIIAPIRGCFQWWVEGQTLDLRPGEISVTLPWQEHGGQGESFNVGELCWIILEVDWKASEELSLGSWSQLPVDLIQSLGRKLSQATEPLSFHNEDASKQMLDILHEIQAQKPHHPWKVNRIIDDLFFGLYRSEPICASNNQSKPSLTTDLNNILKGRLRLPWTLEKISLEMAQSPSWLNKGLREETGYSTMELVTLHRIEEAKALLKESNLNITSISQECGFRTSQYFSSVFKKWVGISPLLFKNKLKHQEGSDPDHPLEVSVSSKN